MTVRIPADVELEDKVLAGLTARQLLILAVPGAGLYLLWSATRHLLTPLVFAALAIPVAAVAIAVALGRRDGLSMDRWVLAAAAHLLTTRPLPRPRGRGAGQRDPEGRTPAGADLTPVLPGLRRPGRVEGAARPVVRAIRPHHHTTTGPIGAVAGTGGRESLDGASGAAGIVDLGPDGLALLAVVSTVNIALRTRAEQHALLACFAGYLHSLTSPVQVLIRAMPLDLTGHINQLHYAARTLAHPALAAAAADHAAHLAELGDTQQLLRRQCILVLREPHHTTTAVAVADGHSPHHPTEGGAGTARPSRRDLVITTGLRRRLAEAADLLAPAGLTVTPLTTAQATAVLRADSALNPTHNPKENTGHSTGYGTEPDDYTDPERHHSGDYPHEDHPDPHDYPDSRDYASPEGSTENPGEDRAGDRAWLLADHTDYLYAPGELEELERAESGWYPPLPSSVTGWRR
jgi:hypothetical protein